MSNIKNKKSLAIITYFLKNQYSSISESPLTWNQLGQKYEMSGEAARAIWKRYKRTKVSKAPLNKRLEEFCKEKGIDPDTVHNARFISHLGPEKETFNITLKKNVNDLGLDGEDIEDAVANVIDRYANSPKFPFNPKTPVNTDANALLINISDVHIGLDIPVNFYNMYWNKEILFQRLGIIFGEIARKVQVYEPAKLVVNFLGDIADGMDGSTTRGRKKHGNHALPQNMDNKEQYNTGVEMLIHIAAYCMQFNLPLQMNFVSNSNHGGFIDYAMGKTALEIFSHTAPALNFNLLEQAFSFVQIDDWDLILTHGYDESLMTKFTKMPLQLNHTWQLSIANKRKQLGSTSDQCLLLRGDQHRARNNYYRDFYDIMIPALSPNSDYIQTNFDADPVEPGFTMIVLYPETYLYQPFVFKQ